MLTPDERELIGAAVVEHEQRYRSPILARYVRVTIEHGDDEGGTWARVQRVREELDPWWLRSIGTNDTTTYDLRTDVPAETIAHAISTHAERWWRVSVAVF
jgi:hypothetical protein